MNNLTPIIPQYTDFSGDATDFCAHALSIVQSEISRLLSPADTHRDAER